MSTSTSAQDAVTPSGQQSLADENNREAKQFLNYLPVWRYAK